MIAKTLSATVLGVGAHPIEVEVNLTCGLNQFTIVGLPDGTIKESRERITAAIANSGFPFPVRKITCNPAPAEMRKIGSGVELSAAACPPAGREAVPRCPLAGLVSAGTFSPEGRVRPVGGLLAFAIAARRQGLRELVLPWESELEVAVVKGSPRTRYAHRPNNHPGVPTRGVWSRCGDNVK